jgi:uncharacterized protein
MLRLCPDRPFPPYSYVPGHLPHPVSDPAGHSYGLHAISSGEVQQGPVASASLVSGWRGYPDYLFGIDLFNHGFYWEAHETWEQVWIACGRSGREADFLKGLIKLAAAGVKLREGRPGGVQRHASRALELFRLVTENLSDGLTAHLGGLDLSALCDAAKNIATNADSVVDDFDDRSTAVFTLKLLPEDFG